MSSPRIPFPKDRPPTPAEMEAFHTRLFSMPIEFYRSKEFQPFSDMVFTYWDRSLQIKASSEPIPPSINRNDILNFPGMSREMFLKFMNSRKRPPKVEKSPADPTGAASAAKDAEKEAKKGAGKYRDMLGVKDAFDLNEVSIDLGIKESTDRLKMRMKNGQAGRNPFIVYRCPSCDDWTTRDKKDYRIHRFNEHGKGSLPPSNPVPAPAPAPARALAHGNTGRPGMAHHW
ncbi:hypothetical protein TrRE_jg7178, partial [Triparma retinervis]